MSLRSEKVSSQIKKVLTKPIDEISKEFNAGLITVTTVRLTEDLQTAKVYISILGEKISPSKLLAAIEDRKGKLRHYIGKNIRLRYTPDLKFFLDDTLDKMAHIQKLIDNVRKNTKNISVNMDDYDEKSFPKD